MSNLKILGCLGSLVIMVATTFVTYFSLRFAWGLELKSVGAFIGFAFAQLFLMMLAQLLLKIDE